MNDRVLLELDNARPDARCPWRPWMGVSAVSNSKCMSACEING